MPLVRRMRRRGVTVTVEAHAEVLFAASGDVGAWTRRLSQRTRAFAAAAAPTNKRPRWSHYGAPLKDTMRASTTYQPGRMRVYGAVGSTAPHAAYVDQGTGVFNGGGAYPAKILPPWFPGSPSLYEHTWKTGGHRVAPVMIKGQRGQFFFDAGLARAMRSMRLRAFQLPGEGAPRITEALNSVPSHLVTGGNTVADGAFRANLEQWREWRDESFRRRRRVGEGDTRYAREQRERQQDAIRARAERRARSKAERAKRSAARSKRWREEQKQTREDREAKKARSAGRRGDKAKFLAAMQEKYGRNNVDLASLEYRDGYWVVLVRKITETKSGDLRPSWHEVRARAKT